MGKEDCNLPDIWVSGTMEPFTKGYCTSQKSKLNKSKSDCIHPNVWVPGTKTPYTKGYCVEPVLKAKSPTPKKSPIKSSVKIQVNSPKKSPIKSSIKIQVNSPIKSSIKSPIKSSPKDDNLIYSDEAGKYVPKDTFSGKVAMQLKLVPALKPIYEAGKNLAPEDNKNILDVITITKSKEFKSKFYSFAPTDTQFINKLISLDKSFLAMPELKEDITVYTQEPPSKQEFSYLVAFIKPEYVEIIIPKGSKILYKPLNGGTVLFPKLSSFSKIDNNKYKYIPSEIKVYGQNQDKLPSKPIPKLSTKYTDLHPPSAMYIDSQYDELLEPQLDYVKSLDKKYKTALKYYTGSGYDEINRYLENLDKGKNNPYNDYANTLIPRINDIDQVFKDVPPTTKSFVVYRGIKLKHKIEQDFISKGYVSCSANKKTSLTFNALKTHVCCFFEITIPKGSRIIPLEGITQCPAEMEILLSRDSKFHVVKHTFTPTGNTMIVKYEENINNLVPLTKVKKTSKKASKASSPKQVWVPGTDNKKGYWTDKALVKTKKVTSPISSKTLVENAMNNLDSGELEAIAHIINFSQSVKNLFALGAPMLSEVYQKMINKVDNIFYKMPKLNDSMTVYATISPDELEGVIQYYLVASTKKPDTKSLKIEIPSGSRIIYYDGHVIFPRKSDYKYIDNDYYQYKPGYLPIYQFGTYHTSKSKSKSPKVKQALNELLDTKKELKKSECVLPNTWVAGTKNPFTKGYCKTVSPVKKVQQKKLSPVKPSVKSPVKQVVKSPINPSLSLIKDVMDDELSIEEKDAISFVIKNQSLIKKQFVPGAPMIDKQLQKILVLVDNSFFAMPQLTKFIIAYTSIHPKDTIPYYLVASLEESKTENVKISIPFNSIILYQDGKIVFPRNSKFDDFYKTHSKYIYKPAKPSELPTYQYGQYQIEGQKASPVQKKISPVQKKLSPIKNYSLKKSECTGSNTWIAGTKNPFTKGYCQMNSSPVEPKFKQVKQPVIKQPVIKQPIIKQPVIKQPNKLYPHKQYHPETANYIKKYETELKPQIDYIKKLTIDQRQALQYYTGSGYTNINTSLYKNNVSGYTASYINKIDEIFKYVPPLEKSLIVYRGIKLNTKISDTFKSASYVSTSSNKKTALNFNAHKNMKCCFFEIYIPKGSHVLPLRPLSSFPEEMEILLSRNSCFVLVKKDFTPKANTMIVKYKENLKSLKPFPI